MTRFSKLCIAVLLTTLSACELGEVGGGADAGGGGMDGSGGGGGGGQSFNAMIKPLVTTCTGCHSGITPPDLSSFDKLGAAYKTKPGNANILVTKGALTGNVHQGVPYFTADQQATVAAWIDSL